MKFKLISVDGEYTGILHGNIFTSNSLTAKQLARLVQEDVTAEEVIEAFCPKLAEVQEENRQIQQLQNVLLESGLFEERNGSYFRIGNPISIPKMLLEKFVAVLSNDTVLFPEDTAEFEALDNFWLKCSLNPNVYARENLFEFLSRWEFVITPKGYLVTYRNVNVKQEGNKELHDFIATNYTRIKGQKKSPKNYWVILDAVDKLFLEKTDILATPQMKLVGNLQELYNNLSQWSETVYTDAHSGKTTIKIGEVVSIPRSQCDESQTECSSGLHTASSVWLSESYYGTQGIVCLVNPMDVVSVPKGDYGKMRSSSYLPIGLAEYENGKIVPITTDIYEDEYDAYTVEQLNKLLQEVNPDSQVIHKLEIKEIGVNVYTSIDEYRKTLESKNVYLYQDEEDEQDVIEDLIDYYDQDEDDWDEDEDGSYNGCNGERG